jgi:YrbI family 3-deoxy-D-manno-octulosonate 8-phosphate phosphatase
MMGNFIHQMKNDVKKLAKRIKIVLSDVDGVLTDGGLYYTEKGDTMKKFHVRDGMGITLLRRVGIPTIIVTKEQTIMVKQWAKNMKVEKLLDGVIKKELVLANICKMFKVRTSEVAYIGDDVNDVALLKKVGLAVVPNDAMEIAKKHCHLVCKTKGGNGVFRELADLILMSKAKTMVY